MSFDKLPRFKQMTKSRKMKRFVGFDGKVGKMQAPPPLTVPKESPDVYSSRQQELAHKWHDDDLAKRVIDLQKRFPYGTVPEMLVMDWLDKNKYVYIYQAQVNGGYRLGGHVPDFAINKLDGTIEAVLVNGDYWHRFPQKNLADKLALAGTYFNGKRISGVVIVWESHLMMGRSQRDAVMQDAVQGIERQH